VRRLDWIVEERGNALQGDERQGVGDGILRREDVSGERRAHAGALRLDGVKGEHVRSWLPWSEGAMRKDAEIADSCTIAPPCGRAAVVDGSRNLP
jgi:hypothetical protein